MSDNQTPTAEPQPLFAKPAGAAKKDGGNSKTGLIVGICCGAGALIILIVVLIVVLVANSGKTLSCDNNHDYEDGSYQKGTITLKYDNDDKLTGISAWEEDHSNEEMKDGDWETLEKENDNYDKNKYNSYSISKIDNKTVRIEFDLKITDDQKNAYGTMEKAKKALQNEGFTCKE